MESGFSKGSIKLDDSRGVYYSGQQISGSVNFELQETLTFSAITINYAGEANVAWEDSEIEKYAGQEIYISHTETLLGGAGVIQLPAGPHSLPFKYLIPFMIPSSFKGTIGEVSYSVKAYLTVPNTMAKEELVKPFQVITPLNLNTAKDEVEKSINMELEEVYSSCCLSCNSSPLTVRVLLPQSGYCPGQVIPVAFQIQHDGSVEVKQIVLQLLSRECYHSMYPKANYTLPEKILLVEKFGPLLTEYEREYTYDFKLPDMIAPNLEHCKLIDVQYFFRVTIEMSGCNEDLEDETELYLGLIPLNEPTDGPYIKSLQHKLPSGPIPTPPPEYNIGFLSLDKLPPTIPHSGRSSLTLSRNSLNIENRSHPNSLRNSQINITENISYPTANMPYPPTNPAYPNGSTPNPYPGTTPYPVVPAPYPTGNTSYPVVTGPYPSGNTPYPIGIAPYPPGGQPYPAASPILANRPAPSAPPSEG